METVSDSELQDIEETRVNLENMVSRLQLEVETKDQQLADNAERIDAMEAEVKALRAQRPKPTQGEIADMMKEAILDTQAENYVTWSVLIADERWSLTLQRQGGRTPADEIGDLQETLEAMRAVCQAEYQRGQSEMQKRCERLGQSLCVLIRSLEVKLA